MVHIAQSLPAAAPVQQVIAGIDILCSQPCRCPRLHPCRQARAVQELPVRVQEAPARFQHLLYPRQHLTPHRGPRQVVQHRKGAHHIEAVRLKLGRPICRPQVNHGKLRREIRRKPRLRRRQQPYAEVRSRVATLEAGLVQHTRQLGVPTAQVQHCPLHPPRIHQLPHAGLDALACC